MWLTRTWSFVSLYSTSCPPVRTEDEIVQVSRAFSEQSILMRPQLPRILLVSVCQHVAQGR